MTDVSACVTVTATTRLNEATFLSTLILDPLGDESRSGGVYSCEANILAEPNTMLVTSGSFETSHTLDVLGKCLVYCNNQEIEPGISFDPYPEGPLAT